MAIEMLTNEEKPKTFQWKVSIAIFEVWTSSCDLDLGLGVWILVSESWFGYLNLKMNLNSKYPRWTSEVQSLNLRWITKQLTESPYRMQWHPMQLILQVQSFLNLRNWTCQTLTNEADSETLWDRLMSPILLTIPAYWTYRVYRYLGLLNDTQRRATDTQPVYTTDIPAYFKVIPGQNLMESAHESADLRFH